MKEKRRTRRRIQRGGYSIDNMLENIRIIKESTPEKFKEGRKNLKQLVSAVKSSDFMEAVALLKDGEIKRGQISLFLKASNSIEQTTDRQTSSLGAQALINFPGSLVTLKLELVNIEEILTSMSTRVADPSKLPELPPSPPLSPQVPALAEPIVAPALQISSEAAPLLGAPSKPERLVKKSSPIEPLTGELSRIFKKGDKLHSIGILTNPDTGQTIQNKTITVVGDYNPVTQSIEVTDGTNKGEVPVEELRQNFRIIPQVQKRLFKKGDRVLIKNPRNIEKFPKAIRDNVQQSTCNDPFYATVQRDQEANISYVKIVCDKGGQYNAQEDELIYVPPEPARLTRALGELPPQPTPVAALADSNAPLQRRDRATKVPSALGAPATITECDGKLIGMTIQAKTCEENLTQVKQQLAQVLEANEKETASLKGEIAKDQAKLVELQDSKNAIKRELEEGKGKRDLMQRHLDGLGGQLKESKREKADVEAEKSGLEDKIARLLGAKQLDDAQTQINLQQIKELRRRAEEASRKEAEIQGKYAEAQAQLNVAEASVADLNSRFATTDALIRTTDEKIREDLRKISITLGEGVKQITDGIQHLVGLADDTRTDIAQSRASFINIITSLQQQLEAAELTRRGEILQAIQSLKEENQARMAALQHDLAETMTEKARLQTQLSQEQAAKATAERQVAAKNEEIARKYQEHVAALQAARQAAAETAQQVKAANDEALQSKDAESVARVARLELVYHGHLEVLGGQLAAALARSVAAEESVADRARLEAELARIREAIAARPPPVAVPHPAPTPPIITGREPPVDVEVPQGNNITINWDARGTHGPWILRVDYGGANPDFQEVTDEAPIVYTVKRPGALMGTIYSVTVV